jgi:hypothetical protein
MPSDKKRLESKQTEKQTQLLDEITRYVQAVFEAGDQECQLKNQQGQNEQPETFSERRQKDDKESNCFKDVMQTIKSQTQILYDKFFNSRRKDVQNEQERLIRILKLTRQIINRKLPVKPNDYLNSELKKICMTLKQVDQLFE